MTVRLEGVEQLAALSKRFREAGNKDLRRELFRGLNRSTRKAKLAARTNALQRLPKRGGLAQRVASSRIFTRNRAGGRNPVVQIVARNPHNIRRIDRGSVRHPVFGNSDRWVTQPVRRGWWTDAMRLNAPEGRRELAAALNAIQRKLER